MFISFGAILALAFIALASSASAQAGPAEKKALVATPDYVKVYATHTKANPKDPVPVTFSTFQLRNVRFNPRNLVGGKAELVIDMNSLSSGNKKRDTHLKSPDFIDVKKRNQAVVTVFVKKRLKRGAYKAMASVTLGKNVQKWPVTLEVISSDKKSVRVKVRHEFNRADFAVGKKDGPVTEKLIAEALLTLTL